MFYYVEYLRAKRALLIVGVFIAIVALIAIGLRLASLGALHTPEGWINEIQHSPTAHVSRMQLPDGTERIVVDDPAKRTHAVIFRKGSLFHMDLTEPSTQRSSHGEFEMGNLSTREHAHNGVSHVSVS